MGGGNRHLRAVAVLDLAAREDWQFVGQHDAPCAQKQRGFHKFVHFSSVMIYNVRMTKVSVKMPVSKTIPLPCGVAIIA
jgi:hypothetical protein